MDAIWMLVKNSFLSSLLCASVALPTALHASKLAQTERLSFDSEISSSFTAIQVLSNTQSPQIVDRSRLEFSSNGMKITRGEGLARKVLLRNFSSGKTWLVDPGRSIQHELLYESIDLELAPVEDAAATPISESVVIMDEPLRSGLLVPAPCFQFPKLKRLNVERWRGQSISAWGCLDASGAHIGSDYFSDDWKLVIRSELIGLQTEELRGITALQFASTHFQISEDYAPVSLDELMNGTNLLQRKYD